MKKLSKNLIITIFSYTFLLVFNIVVSKLVLISYGSEVNGLLSSVNQLYSYVALLEAGIGTATIVALYKPLTDNNTNDISKVCSASLSYYRSVLKWYVLCVILLSFIWPFSIDTNVSYWTMCGVVFVQGISNALTFYFVSTATNYLVADGKNYINVYIHLGITALTYAVKALISVVGGNILLISISLLCVNALKCLFYWLYRKKKCGNIKFNIKADKSLLKQRNSFLTHEIVGCIFSSTDLILISMFCNLKMASVYAVYSMVVMAISTIIGQVFNSTKYVLGNAYQKKDYHIVHDKFNTIYITLVFGFYTITYLLLPAFIKIYTSGINDIDYSIPHFHLLFVIVQLLSSCRNVDTVLIKNALHSKQTVNRAIIEAAINLGASIILLKIFGIYGVLLGTIIALLYRSNDMIIYANKKILKRSVLKEYKLYLFNILLFAAFALLNLYFPVHALGYAQLLLKAVLVSAIVIPIYILSNFLAFRKTIMQKT